MSTTCIDLLLDGWRANLERAEHLFAKIGEDQITAQPASVVNHPAWTMAHLLHYHPAILSLAQGEAVADPSEHPDAPRYDAGSMPIADPSLYPRKSELLDRYRQGHHQVETALLAAPADRMEQPPGLARWTDNFGSTARALQYLMVFHEAEHLGQLASWRRALGLGPLGD